MPCLYVYPLSTLPHQRGKYRCHVPGRWLKDLWVGTDYSMSVTWARDGGPFRGHTLKLTPRLLPMTWRDGEPPGEAISHEDFYALCLLQR